jgi:ATP-dependent Lon protease
MIDNIALQHEVKKGMALTGELTLHGKILRTHGIK